MLIKPFISQKKYASGNLVSILLPYNFFPFKLVALSPTKK